IWSFEVFAEKRRDRSFVFMNDRRDEMTRSIVADLDDELTQIRLDHIHPCRLQIRYEMDLLAHHRFRFDASRTVCLFRDVDDDALCLSRVAGEMNVTAVALHASLGLLQVEVEIVDRVLLDLTGERAESVGIR